MVSRRVGEDAEAFKLRKRVYNKLWYATEHGKDVKRKASKKAYNRNKFKSHMKTKRNRYKHLGLTEEDVMAMFIASGGTCAICGAECDSGRLTRRLNVDHCHTTGKVRGLLCTSCNTKLGWYENRKDKILEYLS